MASKRWATVCRGAGRQREAEERTRKPAAHLDELIEAGPRVCHDAQQLGIGALWLPIAPTEVDRLVQRARKQRDGDACEEMRGKGRDLPAKERNRTLRAGSLGSIQAC